MADQRLGHPQQNTITVLAGTSTTVEITADGILIAAIPGGAGSATVEYALIDKGVNTNWFTWTPGSVSAPTIDSINHYVGVIRLSATTADADFEIRL